MPVTYILRILLSELSELCRPPQMTGEIDCTALVRLLEQFAAVQRAFCDERIVVLFAEVPCCVQPTGNDAHSLELRSRVTDCFFVDCEGLCEVLICDFFKVVLICDLPTGDEEAQR